MMLAAYLMAGLISATEAAGQMVQQLEEQHKQCKNDISTCLQLHKTSRPWDRPVNAIAATTPLARQTSNSDNPTATASGTTRRPDSPYTPPTIDGPVSHKSSIDDTSASPDSFTVDGAIGDVSLVNGIATFDSRPIVSGVPLTIDRLVVDTASTHGGALGLSPSITDPLTIPGEETSSETIESGKTIPLMLLVHPINKSTLTGFDSAETHQVISAPQSTISGMIPHGQSLAAVTNNFIPWAFMLSYFGLFVYFLGHISISSRSSLRLSSKLCYAKIKTVVDDSPKRISSPSRYLYRGSDCVLRVTLEDDALDGEPKASNLEDQLAQLHTDPQADQETTESGNEYQNGPPEKLIIKTKTREADNKQAEEHHFRQFINKQRELCRVQIEKASLAEANSLLRDRIDQSVVLEKMKQRELEKVQKEKSSLAEANSLLRDRLDRKVVSENMKQKDLDLARSEKNRMAEAYRELRESTESKIAAGAVNDRQVDDLSRQLESAKSALELKSTEKEKSNASDEKKIMKFSQQLQDTKSTLEEKTAEANSSKAEADAKISALESELRDCRSQLDAITTEKEHSDAKFKENIAGLKFLAKIFKSIATKETADKVVYKSELQENRLALDTKTASLDALRAEKSSETSIQGSETPPLKKQNANHAGFDEKTLFSWADDFEDLISSNHTTVDNPADENQIAGDKLDFSFANQAQCKTNLADIGDFSRSTVDILEDPPLSSRKATVHLGGPGVVACKADTKETPIEVKGTDSKPKDELVKKGRGFLRKDMNSPGRLFNFGPN